jgi:hypothetical protein
MSVLLLAVCICYTSVLNSPARETNSPSSQTQRFGRNVVVGRVVDCVWNVMKRAETSLRLSAKRTSPFKSAGSSVQSTIGSWGVRISGSNAGYTMFRRGVKGTGYPLHFPVSPSVPLPCFTVCHHVSTGFYVCLICKMSRVTICAHRPAVLTRIFWSFTQSLWVNVEIVS